jgi:tetrahydromethanopterin S-methyltransferase subunit G
MASLFHITIEKIIVDSNDEEVKKRLRSLTNKLELFMAKTQERFDDLMARLDTITNDIAADYQKLLDEITNNSVSDASITAAEANIAKLESLGASVDNPVPPEEPTEPTA